MPTHINKLRVLPEELSTHYDFLCRFISAGRVARLRALTGASSQELHLLVKLLAAVFFKKIKALARPLATRSTRYKTMKKSLRSLPFVRHLLLCEAREKSPAESDIVRDACRSIVQNCKRYIPDTVRLFVRR